jgi:glycosyltransferase involved in cell wall biosynthesis
MPSSISVVIPAYNEAGAIEATLHRLKTVAQDHHWSLEVIVVDDGSSDETSAMAKKAQVQVIRHPANGGYGLSLQHGIVAAKNEIVAITDADGTYPDYFT